MLVIMVVDGQGSSTFCKNIFCPEFNVYLFGLEQRQKTSIVVVDGKGTLPCCEHIFCPEFDASSFFAKSQKVGNSFKEVLKFVQ